MEAGSTCAITSHPALLTHLCCGWRRTLIHWRRCHNDNMQHTSALQLLHHAQQICLVGFHWHMLFLPPVGGIAGREGDEVTWGCEQMLVVVVVVQAPGSSQQQRRRGSCQQQQHPAALGETQSDRRVGVTAPSWRWPCCMLLAQHTLCAPTHEHQ